MATYPVAPAHERLAVFFGNFFREIRKAESSTYGAYLTRAEQEFQRLGYRDKISGGVENILIVRLDEFGDVILISGFLREVRANFPRARITLVVKSLARPLVEFCPYVNEVLTFDIKSLNRKFPVMLENIAVFCREHLWQKKFSVAFSPKFGGDTFPGVVMTWLSGARERFGWPDYPYKYFYKDTSDNAKKMDRFLLNRMSDPPGNIYASVERNFYLLKSAGFKVNQKHMELFYGAADVRRAHELLEDIPPDSKKVVLGIGAGGASRQYPVEKFLPALNELLKKNLTFVIVGGKSELNAANFLEKNLPLGKVLNLVDKTTLRETEAVIAQMDYYIGNDSGVMHMAAASKIPVLAIYRDAVDKQNIFPLRFSESQNFPPYQTKSVILRPAHPLGECATLPPCYGYCHHDDKPHCITQITPQEIVDGFEKLQHMV